MLILSRRLHQAIVIGGRVKVTMLAISENHVTLGVEAPPHIVVDREEIHLRRQADGVQRKPIAASSVAVPQSLSSTWETASAKFSKGSRREKRVQFVLARINSSSFFSRYPMALQAREEMAEFLVRAMEELAGS